MHNSLAINYLPPVTTAENTGTIKHSDIRHLSNGACFMGPIDGIQPQELEMKPLHSDEASEHLLGNPLYGTVVSPTTLSLLLV